jgi:hypothetical protein
MSAQKNEYQTYSDHSALYRTVYLGGVGSYVQVLKPYPLKRLFLIVLHHWL